jgi:hypothetical protein
MSGEDEGVSSCLLRKLADAIDRGEPVAAVLVYAEDTTRMPTGCARWPEVMPAGLCRQMRGLLLEADKRLWAEQMATEVLGPAPEPDLPFEAPSPPTPRQSGLRLIESGRS